MKLLLYIYYISVYIYILYIYYIYIIIYILYIIILYYIILYYIKLYYIILYYIVLYYIILYYIYYIIYIILYIYYIIVYILYYILYYIYLYIVEGNLEVKLPTIWTHEKQRWEESEKRKEERISKKRKSQKREDPGARKGRKVAKHGVFPMICGSGGSKSRLAKAAGAEPAGQIRDEKLHAVVARSEKAKSTSRLEHFWKLRCRKSARKCGTKHISRPKC